MSSEKDRLQAAKFLNNLAFFLSDEDREKEEIAKELRAEGLDPEAVLARFHRILSEYAPTWKERAEKERQAALAALESLREKPKRTREELVSAIRRAVEFLEGQGAGIVVGAYHRKFEQATDADLESLLADLNLQVEALRKKAPGPGEDTNE